MNLKINPSSPDKIGKSYSLEELFLIQNSSKKSSNVYLSLYNELAHCPYLYNIILEDGICKYDWIIRNNIDPQSRFFFDSRYLKKPDT